MQQQVLRGTPETPVMIPRGTAQQVSMCCNAVEGTQMPMHMQHNEYVFIIATFDKVWLIFLTCGKRNRC